MFFIYIYFWQQMSLFPFVFILEILVLKGDWGSQEEEQEGPPHGCSESTLNTQPRTGYNYKISEMGRSDSIKIGRDLNSARDELNIW